MDRKNENQNQDVRETYSPPQLVEWGSVSDLTRTGRTQPGLDAKGGSAASRGR